MKYFILFSALTFPTITMFKTINQLPVLRVKHWANTVSLFHQSLFTVAKHQCVNSFPQHEL